MSQFLEGIKNTNCIAWLDRNEGKTTDLTNDNGIYRYLSDTLSDNKYLFLTVGITTSYLVRSNNINTKWIGMMLMNSINSFTVNNTIIATGVKLIYGMALFTTGGVYNAIVSLYT